MNSPLHLASYVQPFWLPDYGEDADGRNWTRWAGGTEGRVANHSTLVPLAFRWLEAELRGEPIDG